MTALTQARHDERQEGAVVDVIHDETTKIYHGGAVTAHTTGKARAGVPQRPFLGVAMEDNNTTKPYIRVQTTGVYSFAGTGFTAADVGKNVVLVDDQTVAIAATPATDVVIGKIYNVESATKVRVRI